MHTAHLGTIHEKPPIALDPIQERMIVMRGATYRLYHLDDLTRFSELSLGVGHPYNYFTFDNSADMLAVAEFSTDYRVAGHIYRLADSLPRQFNAEKRLTPISAVMGGSTRAVFSPHAALLAVADIRGNISIIDVASLMDKTRSSFKIPMKLIASRDFTSQALSWSPHGKLLAHVAEMGNSGNVRGINLWTLPSGEAPQGTVESGELFTYQARGMSGERSEAGLAFSPDSRLLAVGGDRHIASIKLFDTERKNIFYETPNLKAAITTLLFSPSGEYLFSSGMDGILRIWRLRKLGMTLSVIEEVEKEQFPGEIFKIALSQPEKGIIVAYDSESRSEKPFHKRLFEKALERKIGLSRVSLPPGIN